MHCRLYDAYHEVSTGEVAAEGPLPAVAIPGRAHDFVSSDPYRQPLLLLSCATSVSLRRPPIKLQYLTVEFGVRYRVRTSSMLIEDDFVVIALRGDDLALAEPFCFAGDALLAAMPAEPSASDIERVVRQFVEVLSALSLPSPRALAGLWAELWLMCAAAERHAAVAAWHLDTTDRFDFSFPRHFIEVKATEQEQRGHDFAYEQLRRSERPVRVASLRLRRTQGGKSVTDLVEMLQAGLSAELRAKLVRNVFSAIGSAVSDAAEIRFDEAFADANLRIIDAERVPVVFVPEGSPISAVRFRVNLDDSSLAADLIKPPAHVALQLP